MIKELRFTTEFKEVKAKNKDLLRIEGMASTSSVDRDGDVILPSAWELGDFLKNPILLANHNHREPIGKVVSVDIVDNGLKVVAEVSNTAEKITTMIKEGILKTFSVGFRLLDGDWKEGDDFFTITKASLHELSIVSIPANQDAVFSISKSLNGEEYEEFKKEFNKQEGQPSKPEEEIKKISQTLEEDMASKKPEVKVEVKDSGTELLLKEIANRLKAVEDREKAQEAEAAVAAAEAKDAEFTALKTGATDMAKALEDLQSEVNEKAEEIKALNESKMKFVDKGSQGEIAQEEKDAAVFLAKAQGKSIQDTAYGKALTEKLAAGPHISTMLSGWEEDYNTRVFNDIKNLLVVEPLFGSINMSNPTMYLPINPEAGSANWIDPANYGSTNGSSTGAAAVHALTEQTLIAYKLASKEYVSLEETEDSIIALMPIIRDAVVRRMVNASDTALLRGTAVGVADPIAGLTKIANTDTNELATADQPGVLAGDLVTVAMLGKTRQLLGQWGLNPKDIVYLVSTEAYFDLLQDPDFRTMDLVGNKATILTGQIGSVNGSPVIVSTSFEAKAATKPFVACVNKSNFLVGNFRGLNSERDYIVEDQRTVLVSTRRMGFMQTIAGNAVATGAWKA